MGVDVTGAGKTSNWCRGTATTLAGGRTRWISEAGVWEWSGSELIRTGAGLAFPLRSAAAGVSVNDAEGDRQGRVLRLRTGAATFSGPLSWG